jgi:hypothetical protein
MKKIIIPVLFCLLFGISLQGFAEDAQTNENIKQKTMTIKLYGGYNFWLLGSTFSIVNFFDVKLNSGGFSFGADVLFLDPEKIQFGLGFASLPMLNISGRGMDSFMNMYPLTGNVVFNMGYFYTELGLGVAFLSSNIDTEKAGLSTNFSLSSPSPSFIIKAGLGFNIKLSDYIGLNLGTAIYLPFSDFGIYRGSMLGIPGILFFQFSLKGGINIYL